VWYDRRNAACHSAFAKSDAAPNWVRNNPDLAAAWALDRFVASTKTAARRRRLDGELAKIGEEWSLSDSSANPSRARMPSVLPQVPSTLAATALCTAQEKAKRLIHEGQVAAGQECCGPPVPFRCWRDIDVRGGRPV
jgi:hypothetical protein